MNPQFQIPHKTNVTPLPDLSQTDHKENEGVTAKMLRTPLLIKDFTKMVRKKIWSDLVELGRIWLKVSPHDSPSVKRWGNIMGIVLLNYSLFL